jgi:Tfp pilus assembly protein FimT
MLNDERGMLDECTTKATSAPAAQHSAFSIHRSPLALRAFTLIEILIVIGLIVLIIALAVPAFSFITGSRSVDAGENLVSAMLGRARAEAIRNNRIAGVAFFRDAVSQRAAMALVVPAPERGSLAPEPPGLEQYKSWRQFQENGTTATQYTEGDVVIVLAMDNDVTPAKLTTQLFVCKLAHTSSATSGPPANATYWGTLDQAEIDTLAGYEYQLLPPGVGAQTVNDPDPTPGVVGGGAPAAGRDRYIRTGMILFDGSGALMHRKYTISPPPNTNDPTKLFFIMGYDQRGGALNNTAVGAAVAYPLFSQLGVVLYDEELFKTAGGDDTDPTVDNAAYNTTEISEESWLDQNSLSLMINRYNGTLVRGE